jgi:hypothetical protein
MGLLQPPTQATQNPPNPDQKRVHTKGGGTHPTNQCSELSSGSRHACASAAVGSASPSLNVAIRDESNRPIVHNQPSGRASISQRPTSSRHCDLTRPQSSSIASLEDVSSTSNRLASMSLGVEGQFLAPEAVERSWINSISDAELENISRLWDWDYSWPRRG